MATFDRPGLERKGGDILRQTLFWFTPLVMANQLLYFAGVNLHLLFVFLAAGVVMGMASWPRCRSRYARAVLGFVLYSLASVFLFFFHDVPLESYLVEVDKYVCAMAFFFIGANRENTGDDYERGLLWGCLACFLLGFWFYFAAPGWYARRLVALRAMHWYRSEANEATILDYSRFSSFWGTSYPMGFFGMVALCLAIGQIVQGRRPRDRALGWVVLPAAWGACILSQQRVAMGCSTLAVAMNLLYAGIVERRKGAWWLAGALAMALVAATAFSPESLRGRYAVVADQLETRFGEMDFGEAMAERTGQYAEALGSWESVWFGYGIGSASGYARSKQFMGVNDGNWVKILCEQGLAGVVWFGALLAAGLWRGARRFGAYRAETSILAFFALAAIGSNAFCLSGLYAMPFWYALGRVWNGAEWRRRAAEGLAGGRRRTGREKERGAVWGRGGTLWSGFGGRAWRRRWGWGGRTLLPSGWREDAKESGLPALEETTEEATTAKTGPRPAEVPSAGKGQQNGTAGKSRKGHKAHKGGKQRRPGGKRK